MRNTYVNMQEWMIDDLQLQGKELTVYSIIYGFSQGGQGEAKCSLSYFCKWLGCTRPTVIKILKKLESDGLIEKLQSKTENNFDVNRYVAVPLDEIHSETDLEGSKATLNSSITSKQGVVKLNARGSKATLNNNNINNNNTNNAKKASPELPLEVEPPKVRGKTKKPINFRIPVELRKKEFIEKVKTFKDKYDRDMLNEFVAYWTQYDEDADKPIMLWEKTKQEAAFQVGNRLMTKNRYWKSHQKKKTDKL